MFDLWSCRVGLIDILAKQAINKLGNQPNNYSIKNPNVLPYLFVSAELLFTNDKFYPMSIDVKYVHPRIETFNIF